MELATLTRSDLIFLEVPGTDGPTVLQALARNVAQAQGLGDGQEIYRRLLEREQLASTGIGAGVAIPHCKLPKLEKPLLALGITTEPIDFSAVDSQPVRLFLLILSPENAPAMHLQALSAVSRWIKEAEPAEALLASPDIEGISTILATASGGA